jgi:hypothetical protein
MSYTHDVERHALVRRLREIAEALETIELESPLLDEIAADLTSASVELERLADACLEGA